MAQTKEKYSKIILEFTADEWILVGLSNGLQQADLDKYENLHALINHIVRNLPSEFTDPENDFYYFKSTTEKNGEESIELIQTPAKPGDYKPKILTHRKFALGIESYRELIAKDEKDFGSTKFKPSKPLSEDSLDENPDQLTETIRLLGLLDPSSQQFSEIFNFLNQKRPNKPKKDENPTSHLAGIYKQKIRYNPDMEITRFLTQVESYAHANGIFDDTDIIALAKAGLNQHDEGAMAIDLVADEIFYTWSNFKAKIIKILGHSKEYYRQKFYGFKRNDEKLGLALSKLSQSFRRGWEINREFSIIEKDMIKSQFINSLDGNLKIMLKAEEHKLTLETILERATQLETCFEPSHKVSAISNTGKTPEKINDILEQLAKQHQEMLKMQKDHANAINKLSAQNSHPNPKFNSQKSNSNKSKRDPEVYKVLQGLCANFVKGQECRRKNCMYKHDGVITAEQLKAVGKK